MEDHNIFFNMAPDIRLKLNLSGSNYAYLKQLFMTSKVSEPLKFGSIYIYTFIAIPQHRNEGFIPLHNSCANLSSSKPSLRVYKLLLKLTTAKFESAYNKGGENLCKRMWLNQARKL